MKVEALAAEMLDREAIRHVMMRYARAIDRVDAELLRSVYWEDATDNHGSYNGNAAGFIDWVIPGLGRMDQTQHMLGNIYIEIHGSAAAVESYFQAYHRMRGEGDHRFDIVCAGRYVDRMEKRDGEWRVARRELAYDWYREYPDSADWGRNQLNLPLQTNRAPTDISYAIIAETRARWREELSLIAVHKEHKMKGKWLKSAECLTFEVRDQIAYVTLNRPEKRNALSLQLMREIRDAMTEADDLTEVRCVVLSGNGQDFCAGADIAGGPVNTTLNLDYDPSRYRARDDGYGGNHSFEDDLWLTELGSRTRLHIHDMHKLHTFLRHDGKSSVSFTAGFRCQAIDHFFLRDDEDVARRNASLF